MVCEKIMIYIFKTFFLSVYVLIAANNDESEKKKKTVKTKRKK